MGDAPDELAVDLDRMSKIEVAQDSGTSVWPAPKSSSAKLKFRDVLAARRMKIGDQFGHGSSPNLSVISRISRSADHLRFSCRQPRGSACSVQLAGNRWTAPTC